MCYSPPKPPGKIESVLRDKLDEIHLSKDMSNQETQRFLDLYRLWSNKAQERSWGHSGVSVAVKGPK